MTQAFKAKVVCHLSSPHPTRWVLLESRIKLIQIRARFGLDGDSPLVVTEIPGGLPVTAYKLPPANTPRRATKDVVNAIVHGPTGFPWVTNTEMLADQSVHRLLEMMTYMRPAGTPAEEAFIAKFIVPAGSKKDEYGNRWIWVNKSDGSTPDIMFSSHTDTVHTKGGSQKIELADGMIFAEDSSCLGADDTAGIWLMLEMIKAKVPGVYVFHREEECGGHGSTWIAKNMGGRLKHIKAAIAFDRKGYDSVITHQAGGRCCSDAFAKSLAAQLGGKFAPDSTGLFTDTANYTDYIGECTNLSVGYHMAHGPAEHQDVGFLMGLRDRLLEVDWSQLVCERKPGEKDPDDDWMWDFTGYGYGGTRSNWQRNAGLKDTSYGGEVDYDELEEMADYVYADHELTARFLVALGYTTADIENFADTGRV